MPAFSRAAIEELYTYTGFTWDGIVHAIRDLGPDNFAKPVPGSGWPSFRDVLGHHLFAYDRWLAIMYARPMKGIDGTTITTLDDAKAAYDVFRGEFRALLDAATEAELHEVRDFLIDEETIRYSLGELLVHLLLHERGHFGDVTTLFSQLGIEPDMALEYRFMLGRH